MLIASQSLDFSLDFGWFEVIINVVENVTLQGENYAENHGREFSAIEECVAESIVG